MKARRTPALRERKRFELRQEARASRTLRRYGICEADVWTAEERAAAGELIEGLKVVAGEQRERLRNQVKTVDPDTWLWGDREPDYESLLATEVTRVAAGDDERKRALAKIAERLLDRSRVRYATSSESAVAAELLANVAHGVNERDEGTLRRELRQRAEELSMGNPARLRAYEDVVGALVQRVSCVGRWDERVEDGVPREMQPLHMSAVQEALGALIPARLHKSFDQATKRAKEDFGAIRGCSVLVMENWRVSVRAEDALARGRLQEDALEFFVLVLRRICQMLKLTVAVASKTVGKEVGRQEDASKLARVMEKWRQVWAREEVRQQEELLLPVAVDEKSAPQDWLCVAVRSVVAGEKLGEAKRLRVLVYDAAQRASAARRIALNVDALLRGVGARVDAVEPVVEFADRVPECRVNSQRVLCSFGLLLGRVAAVGQEAALDARSARRTLGVGVGEHGVVAGSAGQEFCGISSGNAALR